MKRKYFLIIMIGILFALVVSSGIYMLNLKEQYATVKENGYNESFNNLVNYMNNIENFLAKLQVSKSSNIATDNLVQIWKEANLASVYISKIPNSENDLENISKFLNQLSDYSYTLSKQTIDGKELTGKDFENIKKIHGMSKDIEESLNQMTEELNSGEIKWSDFAKKSTEYAQSVDNFNIFSNLDTNLKEYEGLIYDGAYSNHVSKENKKGLTGNDISEEEAKEKIRGFFKDKNIENIKSNGFIENVEIPYYNFNVSFLGNSRDINISISKKGGRIIEFNSDYTVKEEKLSLADAKKKGKEFLENHEFQNMEETYFIKQNNILTINYAYSDKGIICYPDLIKVKVSLENGEVLGLEAFGYLNSHYQREYKEKKITIEEARENLSPNVKLISEREAIIPTEWKTEIYVYEFKGKVDDIDFLMYVNVETGKEEDVLIILETEGGMLTI